MKGSKDLQQPYNPKFLVAPDSFKGSLSAAEFCDIARECIQESFPNSIIDTCPMADGGEGTLEALLHSPLRKKLKRESAEVTGPNQEPTAAEWLWLPESGFNHKTAFIEMAQASGIHLSSRKSADVRAGSSKGTGELIKIALEQECQTIVVTLGGSGTNDGGAGLLHALGIVFLDHNNQTLQPNLRQLAQCTKIDSTQLDSRLRQIKLIGLCDVNNPLWGPSGASSVYGPQKGLTHSDIEAADEIIRQLSACTQQEMKLPPMDQQPGSGAAGGCGWALQILGGKLSSGFSYLSDLYGITRGLEDSNWDWVITGEGSYDGQSSMGKIVGSLAEGCHRSNIPLLSFCGQINAKPLPGIVGNFPLTMKPCSLDEGMKQTKLSLGLQLRSVLQTIRFAHIY